MICILFVFVLISGIPCMLVCTVLQEVAGDKKRKKGNKRFKRFCAALRSSFMHFSIPTLHIISY